MAEPRVVDRPGPADLEQAWEVVGKHLRPTPVSTVHPPGTPAMTLKLENLQPTGAFKVRGALAALAALDPDTEVVTASAGNHALGIAHAATALGRRATVVTATTASPAKVEAIRAYGIDLVQAGTSYDDAEAHALDLAARGARYVSAYNDTHVIAGQATIGRELDTQVDGPLTVVCGVGGGGMASGLALWAAGRDDVRVVGVEAAASTATSASVAAGTVVDVEIGDTIADGLAGGIEPGSVTVPILAELGVELITVTEDELRTGLRYLAGARNVLAEGAGAAAAAAVLAGKVEPSGTVVAVVSGGNIALPLLADVLAGS
ncbi:threonine ammonia-lyase [Amycolatopsis suaedae]|uniref:Pyridoxal-phosphate dependent enzyme n=1 Tax=Amycolatopsis suaedae TaxID=2510978 RepID=A0A4Q7J822_9PSEU|nr:pyridoxal-phosphate dependent enzyme [Amycolatopsis suaedae]RZQ63831.1 pyridoxal-phosphate dependent enzyme [Amycolatopsis suaedae]